MSEQEGMHLVRRTIEKWHKTRPFLKDYKADSVSGEGERFTLDLANSSIDCIKEIRDIVVQYERENSTTTGIGDG